MLASICSSVKCADSSSIARAPDLDGRPGGEVIAVVAYRIPHAVDCPGCAPPIEGALAQGCLHVILVQNVERIRGDLELATAT